MRAIIDLHSSAYLTAIGLSPRLRDDDAGRVLVPDREPTGSTRRLARFIRLVARAASWKARGAAAE
jgi:hypothetical protein